MKKIFLSVLVTLITTVSSAQMVSASSSITTSKVELLAHLKKDIVEYKKRAVMYEERSKQKYVNNPEAYIALSAQMKALSGLAQSLEKSVAAVKTQKQLTGLRLKHSKLHLMSANDIKVAIEANNK